MSIDNFTEKKKLHEIANGIAIDIRRAVKRRSQHHAQKAI
jgi:hypothetical protein